MSFQKKNRMTRLCGGMVGCLLLGTLLGSHLSACDGNPVAQPESSAYGETTDTQNATATDTGEAESAPLVDLAEPVRYLLDRKWITPDEIRTADSSDIPEILTILTVSLGDILTRAGVEEISDAAGEVQPVTHYESWYLYTLGNTCSMFYMRTDSQSAGMGVSFIELNFDVLRLCLEKQDEGGEALLALTEVTSASAQGVHTYALTNYFQSPASEGAYLMAECFVEAVTATAVDSLVEVPAHYAACSDEDAEFLRVAEALRYLDHRHPGLILWENDRPAQIRIADQTALTDYEKQAILALYTMDVTFCSFAAEVAVHAMMCNQNAVMSYERCKIADMAVGEYNGTAGFLARLDNEYGFYNLNSTAVKSQEEHHPSYAGEYAAE